MKPLIVFELKKMFGRKITWVGMAAILLINTLFLVSTSQNMARVCLMLNLLLILVTAPVFSGEYGTMDSLLLSARYGRSKCAAAKILAAFCALNLTAGLALYGKSGLNANILFAPVDFAESYIPFPITCLTLLRYQTLLVFTCALGTVGLTLLFSALCGSPLSALALSLAAFALPAFLPADGMRFTRGTCQSDRGFPACGNPAPQ